MQSWLAERLDAARRQRLALDHYALVRPSLLDYELRVRPAMTALDALQSVLTDIRDQSGPAMDSLADALLDLDYAYVLVDSAPILGIADSLSLARALHHVLFVGRLDRLTLDTIFDAREMLDRFDTEPLGMVVVGARGEASPYYLTAARPTLDES